MLLRLSIIGHMRNTKLSVICDHVIEAGWLAAVVTVPLFFNVFSSRVFEPDKLTLLRSIALFMALAWLVKVLDTGLLTGERNQRRAPDEPSSFTDYVVRFTFRIPLVLPTLLLVLVYLVSSATSIMPRISLWGSYQRLQGTYTLLAYVIIFLLILQGLRTRAQLDRLITASILASLPVALYGLIQHYGLDPLPWLGDVETRVASTMGNSIFVAAYLIMVVPLTLLRLLQGFGRLVEAEDALGGPFIEATGYLFIFLAQLLAIFFSQSRGPWLGLLSALFVFSLLWAVTRGRRRLVMAIIGAATLGALFLVVLNLPRSPLGPVKSVPYVGRLGRVFETDRGTGKVRVLIWEGAVDLIQSDPLRALIGYGPETMHVAYNPYYPPELAHYEARNASPDRAHNETFDALVITGVIGFAAYVFLFVSLFYYGLKWLGLVEASRERNWLLTLIGAGGVLALAGFYFADGTARFFGVALPAGMIVGLFAYLIWAVLVGHRRPETDVPFNLLLIALLAATIGHFVEIHFGIAIAATRTLFWTYAGLIVVVGYLYGQRPELVTQAATTPRPSRPTSRRGRRGRGAPAQDEGSRTSLGWDGGWPWQPALAVATMGSVLMLTIAYDFITNPARNSSAVSVLVNTLFSRWDQDQFVVSPSILWLTALVWLLTGLLGLAATRARRSENASVGAMDADTGWWLRAFAIYGSVTLAIFVVFGLIIAAHLAPPVGSVTLTEAINQVASHITIFYFVLFAAIIGTGVVLAWQEPLPARAWNGGWSLALAPVAAVAVFFVIAQTNLDVVKADTIYKQAWNGYHQAGNYDAAIATYQLATNLEPEEDYYHLFTGKAYLEQVATVDDPARREQLLEASRSALLRAQRLNPLNPDHAANLARLHQQWGSLIDDPERRAALLEQALEYHGQATSLAPHAAHLYNEWALTLDRMGRHDAALKKLQTSEELDPQFAETPLLRGEVYRHAEEFDAATQAYERALELDPDRADAHRALALLYGAQGQIPEAIEHNRLVLEQRPNDVTALEHLAFLYEQQGDLPAALSNAQRALALLPDNEQLQALVRSLEQQTP